MRILNLCNLIIIPIFITILFLIGCGEADKTTVDSTLPKEDAVDVPVDSSIMVVFSGGIDETTINSSAFTVVDSKGRNIEGTVKYDAATYTATFTPSASFAGETTYTVSINGLEDIKGNDVPPYSWTFTTCKAIQPFMPLSIGNWWKYSTKGIKKATTRSIEVTGTTDIGGQTFYLLTVTDKDASGTQVGIFTLQVSNSGGTLSVWRGDRVVTVIPKEASAGQSWMGEMLFGGGIKPLPPVECIGPVSVEVKGAMLECIQIRQHANILGDTYDLSEAYAPGIGLAIRDTYSIINLPPIGRVGAEQHLKLVDYEVK